MSEGSIRLETERLVIRRYEERDVTDILDYSRHEPSDEHRRRNVEAALLLDLPAGNYSAEWVNTKTGSVDRSETFRHGGGQRKLVSPRFSDDVALRVLAAGQ